MYKIPPYRVTYYICHFSGLLFILLKLFQLTSGTARAFWWVTGGPRWGRKCEKFEGKKKEKEKFDEKIRKLELGSTSMYITGIYINLDSCKQICLPCGNGMTDLKVENMNRAYFLHCFLLWFVLTSTELTLPRSCKTPYTISIQGFWRP